MRGTLGKHWKLSKKVKKKKSELAIKLGIGKWFKGRKYSKEHCKKISEYQKTRKHQPQEGFQKGCVAHQLTKKTRFKKGYIPWHKNKHTPKTSGKNHWNWKGGKSNLTNKIFSSLEYKMWRNSVFTRDNFICQDCGYSKGGNLEAHHIKPRYIFPELTFAIDNGITLCKDCHKKTNTYGGKVNRKKNDSCI